MSQEVVHRLGVAVGVLVAVGWGLRAVGKVRRERQVRRRLAELMALRLVAEASVPRARVWDLVRRWGVEAAVVGVGWVLVGGGTGAVLGVVGAVGVWRWRRGRERRGGEGGAEVVDTAAAARQLPLAADLLAACVAAGAGPVVAAQAVGEAIGGPVGEGLARGAAEVRLGGEPRDAWGRLARVPGAEGLARVLERADVSGLPAAGPVARVAADARAERLRAATARARRAGVMVTAPVGLCFLPAFVVVGVVPVMVGLAGGVMGG
ncbi:type II secretion system F family protein [Streptomyces sp. NPDC004539]|uniref:type II secretion system F family protein n=1 Tax=Streptomyces sp. NPDC004539 TaxID=3154280 RepID=UPI0033A8FD6D